MGLDRLLHRFTGGVLLDAFWGRVTTGAFWSLTGAVVLRGFNLGASVLFGRILGKAGFGQISMIQTTAMTFAVLGGLGVGITATKHVAELRQVDPARVGRILGLSAAGSLLSGLFWTVVMVLASPLLARKALSSPDLSPLLAVGAGLVFFGVTTEMLAGTLAGLEAFRPIALANLTAAVIALPVMVMLAVRYGTRGAVLGFVLNSGLLTLFYLGALALVGRRDGIALRLKGCLGEWRVLWAFSLPAYLSSLLMGPALWGSSALLANQQGGYEQLGLFYAADRWKLLVLFVPATLTSMGLPLLSNLYGLRKMDDFDRLLRTYAGLTAGLTALLGVFVMVLAVPLLGLYGRGYEEGWPVIIALCLSTPWTALNTVYGQAVVSMGGVWIRFYFDMLLAAVIFGCASLIIPALGALGLALSYLAGFSVVAVGLWLVYRNLRERAGRLKESPGC